MLKPLIAATALGAILALASGAHAEDYDWTGAYVGVGIGGVALGTSTTGTVTDNTGLDADAAATTPDPSLDLSAGYNWLLKKKLLLGVEGDFKLMLPQDGASQ